MAGTTNQSEMSVDTASTGRSGTERVYILERKSPKHHIFGSTCMITSAEVCTEYSVLSTEYSVGRFYSSTGTSTFSAFEPRVHSLEGRQGIRSGTT